MQTIKKIVRISFLGILILAAACNNGQPVQETPSSTPQASVITVENVSNLQSVSRLNLTEVTNVKWTLDGKAFWVQGIRSASLYDSQTLQEIASYDVGESTYIYDVSPDGRLIAYALEEPAIVLYDVLDQQEVKHIALDSYSQQAAFSPDGSILGAISSDVWQITLWDVKTGEQIKTLTGFETAAPVYSFRFGADGKTVLWIARATIQPIDIESNQMGPRIGLEDFISRAALSPDGNLLATSSAGTVDGEYMPIVTIWDAHTGESLAVFSNAVDDYFSSSIIFSPDGSLLAAGSNGKVHFWNISNFQPAGEISIAAEYVNSMHFSPDGTSLLTCASQGSVQIWQITN
jgi:WD40 repeat protein